MASLSATFLRTLNFQRNFKNFFNVAVIGAAGGIGQPMSLLLKANEQVKSLRLFDIANVDGVAMDISHISTQASVLPFTGNDKLKDCLTGSDLVMIPAGVPRKPGMTRDDLFNMNASIVRDVVTCCAQACPGAFICIITNPVNSTVPIAFEVYKKHGLTADSKICGVTALDIVRSQTFIGNLVDRDPKTVHCDCICGHSGNTIVPLLSQASPTLNLSEEEENKLVTAIQEAGTSVVNAKAGAGSATLSMAFAGAQFGDNVMRGLSVLLGPGGIEKVMGFGELTASETARLEKGIDELIGNINKGIKFMAS